MILRMDDEKVFYLVCVCQMVNLTNNLQLEIEGYLAEDENVDFVVKKEAIHERNTSLPASMMPITDKQEEKRSSNTEGMCCSIDPASLRFTFLFFLGGKKNETMAKKPTKLLSKISEGKK